MIRAILFDLDGTLLGNAVEVFIPAYFKAAAGFFADLIPSEKLLQELRRATHYVVQTPGGAQTNMQKFISAFSPAVGLPWETLEPRFDAFYAQVYPKLREMTTVVPEARPAVEAAFGTDRPVVVATNPLFPTTAIEQRLDWAGIPVDRYGYALVTTIDNMHAAKPQPAYYQEIAEHLGLSPAECLMIGDDVVNDVAAAQVGMKTFLICDPQQPPDVQTDYCGSLALLTSMLQQGELG